MTEAMIEPRIWREAVAYNASLKEALMNPNTDFMTKLLFDARLLAKRFGKSVAYWTNTLFKLKWELRKKALSIEDLAKKLGVTKGETAELLKYLSGLAEVKEEKGKYGLNYNNPFSSLFKK